MYTAFGLAGSLQGLSKATTLDFLHILRMLSVRIHSLNMSSNHWSAADPRCFICSQRMSSSPAALLLFISLKTPHRSFMLKGVLKSEGHRGEHVSAAFGSLSLLEWGSGFP